MHKYDIIISFLSNICKFNIVLTNRNYTMFDTNNDKYFFIFKDGKIKYGYDIINSKDLTDRYSVNKMEKRLLD